jgi:hypothetical protein
MLSVVNAMNKRFGFETELYTTLSCLPLAARQKLDSLGITDLDHLRTLEVRRGKEAVRASVDEKLSRHIRTGRCRSATDT